MMVNTHSECFARIIRNLVDCRQEAERLNLRDLSQVINMAVLQAALEWEEKEPCNGAEKGLEALLRLKMKLAFSERGDNVVLLNSKTAGEA